MYDSELFLVTCSPKMLLNIPLGCALQTPLGSNAVVTTTNRLQFDGRSTAYQRSLRSLTCLIAEPLAAVTLTGLSAADRT